jgi:hypothetical protein
MDIERVIEEIMNGAFPYEIARREGFRNSPELNEYLRKNAQVEIRHTPNYPHVPDCPEPRWYVWPLTPEAAKKYGLEDNIEVYLPIGLAKKCGPNKVVTDDGDEVVYNGNHVVEWCDDDLTDKILYAVDLGDRAAIGYFCECHIHDGSGGVHLIRGVIPRKYISKDEYRAVMKVRAMPDLLYEAAIGEGMPSWAAELIPDVRRARDLLRRTGMLKK